MVFPWRILLGNLEKQIRKWVLFGKRETIWATGFGILLGNQIRKRSRKYFGNLQWNQDCGQNINSLLQNTNFFTNPIWCSIRLSFYNSPRKYQLWLVSCQTEHSRQGQSHFLSKFKVAHDFILCQQYPLLKRWKYYTLMICFWDRNLPYSMSPSHFQWPMQSFSSSNLLSSQHYFGIFESRGSLPGAQLGGALGARASSCISLWPLNKGATHFILWLRPYTLSHPSYYKYPRPPPPLEITQLRPCSLQT